jgi:NAD(P)-dependent dehydrogenase (short-subunit alcohol dehydrogenase family)
VNAFDLTGRRTVVTRARRGIGRAMARGLAETGADIIGVSANLEEAGSEVEKDVTAVGRAFEAIRAGLAAGRSCGVCRNSDPRCRCRRWLSGILDRCPS